MQRKSEEALVKKVVLLEQELALAEIRASNAEKAKTKRAEDRSALADIKHALKGLKQDKTPPPPPGPPGWGDWPPPRGGAPICLFLDTNHPPGVAQPL